MTRTTIRPVLPLLWVLLGVTIAGAQPANLLQNPSADLNAQHWRATGQASVEEVNGNRGFVVRNGGSFHQDVTLPAGAAGQYIVLIGRGSSERINPDGAITGLPYLYGYMLAPEDATGGRILAYLQGQRMLGSATRKDEWVQMWGVFRVPEGAGRVRFFLRQAERRGVEHNGSAARFDDLGLYTFPTEEAAKAFVATSEQAQETRPATDKSAYTALLERVKKGDRGVDFTELRQAFYESDYYHPLTPMMTYRPLYGALAQKNYVEAIRLAQSVLKQNFVEVNAHMVAQLSYQATGDAERAQFHQYVAEGLLNSIKSKGDGKSPDTAFHIISINEEYGLLRSLGLTPTRQSLVQDKGRSFDALTVVDPQTNQQQVVYFNIEKPLKWEGGKKKS